MLAHVRLATGFGQFHLSLAFEKALLAFGIGGIKAMRATDAFDILVRRLVGFIDGLPTGTAQRIAAKGEIMFDRNPLIENEALPNPRGIPLQGRFPDILGYRP